MNDAGLPLRWYVVGAGRLGRTVARVLDEAGVLDGVWTRSAGTAREAQASLGAPVGFGRIPPIGADVVLLAVPDDRIMRTSRLFRAYREAPGAWIHSAGSLSCDALPSGPGESAASVHPLCPLTGGEGDLEALKGGFFAVDGAGVARDAAEWLVGRLGGHAEEVPAAGRLAYHLAATLASNGVYALLDAATTLCARAGVASPPLSAALAGLAKSSASNVARLGVDAASTGPVVRGDVATVGAHTRALAEHAPDLAGLYAHVGALLIEIGARRGLGDDVVAGLVAATSEIREAGRGAATEAQS